MSTVSASDLRKGKNPAELMFTLDEDTKPKVLASSILKPDAGIIVSSFSDLHLNEFRRKSRDRQ